MQLTSDYKFKYILNKPRHLKGLFKWSCIKLVNYVNVSKLSLYLISWLSFEKSSNTDEGNENELHFISVLNMDSLLNFVDIINLFCEFSITNCISKELQISPLGIKKYLTVHRWLSE